MGGWGGSKVFAQKATSSGETYCLSHNRWSNGNAADVKFAVGGSNPGRLTFSAGGGAKFVQPGFESPTQGTPVDCITTRPLPCFEAKGLPAGCGRSCH